MINDLQINFDVERYLQDRNIPYVPAGSPNVSSGHIGLNCFWCGDYKNHLGICLSTKKVNCWRCGPKSILKVVQWVESGCSVAQANTTMNSYRHLSLVHLEPSKRGRPSLIPQVRLPVGSVQPLPKPHTDYLRRRKYDPDTLQRNFNLYGVTIGTQFKQRIIIPIVQAGVLVTFTSLDITEQQAPKYKDLSIEQSIIPAKACVYNLDTVRNTILIVEGPTDVWRMGTGTVCTLSKAFTKAQVRVLLGRGVQHAFVMYDGEADPENHVLTLRQAEKLAHALTTGIPSVEIIEMSHGDPAELTQDKVTELRSELGL